jgi:hypothetical protein
LFGYSKYAVEICFVIERFFAIILKKSISFEVQVEMTFVNAKVFEEFNGNPKIKF